jgi:hypothetical protein
MSAVERCRTAALGGHIARCEDCAHEHIAYNSCRNRHCPKCQAGAATAWLAAREAELLPVGYFHLVFTLPAPIADIAYQNKRQLYDLLMRASAKTTLTIAADPKHLGARIGITSVLHSWGSAMTHHPHVHMIVPGGGLSADGSEWIACRANFFLPVRVLSRLFRRLFLEGLVKLHRDDRLSFFGDHAGLADRSAFDAFLEPLRSTEWVVHPALPHACPPQGPASHPPLRLPGQRQSRRQHRPHPRIARRSHAQVRHRRHRHGRWAERARAPVSLLRRASGHRRGVRARRPAATSARPGGHRQLMTLPQRFLNIMIDPRGRRGRDQLCAVVRAEASSGQGNSRSDARHPRMRDQDRRATASSPSVAAALHSQAPVPAGPIPHRTP